MLSIFFDQTNIGHVYKIYLGSPHVHLSQRWITCGDLSIIIKLCFKSIFHTLNKSMVTHFHIQTSMIHYKQ